MPSVEKRKRVRDRVACKDARRDYCEVCGRSTVEGEGAHHIVSQGSGGPDIPENLIMLCWQCHIGKAHGGHYSKDFLFSVVARREGKTAEEVREYVMALKT